MSSKVDENLNWLAMQYVLDELPVAEREAFESRLAEESAACEAVMAASRLMLTAQSMSTERNVGHPVSKSRRSSRAAWTAFAVACVAVAVVCLFPFVPADRVDSVANSDPAAVELVSLWRTGNVPEVDSDEVDESDDDDVAVPGWMIAAVSLEARAKDPGGLDPVDGIDGSSGKVQEN